MSARALRSQPRIDLHEIAQDQRQHGGADERVEQEEKSRAGGVGRIITAADDREAVAGDEQCGHEVLRCIAAAWPDCGTQFGSNDKGCADGEAERPKPDQQGHDERSCKGEGRTAAADKPRGPPEQRPNQSVPADREQARSGTRVEHREEDIGEKDQHQRRPTDLFESHDFRQSDGAAGGALERRDTRPRRIAARVPIAFQIAIDPPVLCGRHSPQTSIWRWRLMA